MTSYATLGADMGMAWHDMTWHDTTRLVVVGELGAERVVRDRRERVGEEEEDVAHAEPTTDAVRHSDGL